MGSDNLNTSLEGWSVTTWGELVELKYGKSLKGYQDADGEYPVFGTNGQVGWCDKPLCSFPSVIIGRKGAYRGVHYSPKPFFVIDTAFFVVPKDGMNINLKWAYYALLLADINSMDSGSAIPSTSREDFYALPATVPPINVQDWIVEQLDKYNYKIALNRQINTTLESMAQALFKSWFVDFDPVIDNALAAGHEIPDELAARAARREALRQQTNKTTNKTTEATDAVSVEQALPETGLSDQRLPSEIQQLFPDRFVLTEEMGWVPEGWEMRPMKSIAKLVTKSIHPNKNPENLWQHFSIPAFDDRRMPSDDLGESIKSGKYLVPETAILASKLNPEFPRIWMPDVTDPENSICSTEFMPFVPVDANERPYIYNLLKSENVQTEIENRATGSTGSRQRVKPKEIEILEVLVPAKDVRKAFSDKTRAFYERVAGNNRQQLHLANLRDSLLPKLLSGQITIPDAEQQLAEVL